MRTVRRFGDGRESLRNKKRHYCVVQAKMLCDADNLGHGRQRGSKHKTHYVALGVSSISSKKQGSGSPGSPDRKSASHGRFPRESAPYS